MTYETLRVDTPGEGVSLVTLDRPLRRNAFNSVMLAEFAAAMTALRDDDSVKCIVIAGAGSCFSAGFDVKGDDDGPYSGDPSAYGDWRRLRTSVETLLLAWDVPKPTIARVHGACVGAATVLAGCCDLTYVADDARISWPLLPLGGGMLGPTASWFIGSKRARELSYRAGSSMSGAEAASFGWATASVESDLLDEHTLRMANEIALMPLNLLRLKKLAFNRILDGQGFRASLLMSAETDALSHVIPDLEPIRASVRALGPRAAAEVYRQGDAR